MASHTILPAKGGGGYGFVLTFEVPRKRSAPGGNGPYAKRSGSSGYLLGYSDSRSVALGHAFAEIARMWGARFRAGESMDV